MEDPPANWGNQCMVDGCSEDAEPEVVAVGTCPGWPGFEEIDVRVCKGHRGLFVVDVSRFSMG